MVDNTSLDNLKFPNMGSTEEILSALRALVDERDKRYEQRFNSQQEAMEKAFTAAEKAVAAALAAAEKAVNAALTAQKEAVNKAETAAERRFEAVNEFRGQLADQAASFLPRKEYDAQHAALGEKQDAAHQVAMAAIADLRTSRDTSTGKSLGTSAVVAAIFGAVAAAGAIIAAIIAVSA